MIINEGALTANEVADLQNMRNTDFFRIQRKLCAHEYSKLAEYMTSELKTEDMQMVRGMMKGIKLVYGLLLQNAQLSYIDGKLIAKDEEPLPGRKKLRNMKDTQEQSEKYSL